VIPVDWVQLGAVALGVSLGGLVGFWLRRHQAPLSTRARARWASAQFRPARAAALVGLAGFLGCALAEDGLRLFGHEKSGAYFLAKYLFAAGLFVANYAYLRRSLSAPERRASLRPSGEA